MRESGATSQRRGNAFRLTALHLAPAFSDRAPPFSRLFARALLALVVSNSGVAPKSSLLLSVFCSHLAAGLARIPHRASVQGQPAASCLFSCFSFGECLHANGLSRSVRQPKFLIAIQS